MLIMKFGGTSVGKPDRLKKIANLVLETPGRKIIVLSALSGTTNTLVKIGEHLLAGKKKEAETDIATLEKHYEQYAGELFASTEYKAIGQDIVVRYFSLIRLLSAGAFDDRSYRELLAQGELASTEFFYYHLRERKIESRLLPALHFMSIDENQEPELEKIGERLKALLPESAPLTVLRYRLPNLRALNFVIVGLLGRGVAASTRPDPQAKALGEELRAVTVDVPVRLLD